VLLSKIFWDLGNKEDLAVDDDGNSHSYASIRHEDYDEEAEIQARIWNNFMRSGADEENSQYLVRPSEVYAKLSIPVIKRNHVSHSYDEKPEEVPDFGFQARTYSLIN
jgi:hypothetical protein